MSMKINYNVSAIIANNSLKINDGKLTTSLERLSSGYKINSAKDDAAGLAISRRMNAQIKGLRAAEQDAKDGVSVAEIADGALAEVQDILQRMNELAIKSSTGTITDDDRVYIQQEVEQLANEIDRIGNSTEYNSQKIFTGAFDLKGYTDDIKIKVDTYSDAVDIGDYTFEFPGDLNFEIAEDGSTVLKDINGDTGKKLTLTRPDNKAETFLVSGDNYHLTLTGDNGDEIVLDIAGYGKGKEAGLKPGAKFSITPTAKQKLELNGYGAMTFQIGSNESQTMDIRFEKLSMESLGFKNQDTDANKDMILKMDTEEHAKRAIAQVSNAIDKVSSMRSKIGAYQNRLEHTETNLSTSEENMTGAYSRIMDTDMSEEMTNYSNLQIISQAATAILAQANERPSQMLQLLQ